MRYLAAYINHRAARTAQTARRKRLKGVMQSLKNSYDSLRMICVDEDVWEALEDIRQAYARLQNVARRMGVQPPTAPPAIVIDTAPDVLETEAERVEDRTFFEHSQPDVMALLQHIEGLETQLAEAQAQVEGLAGAIQHLKDRMTTGYIDCEGPYEDICATRNPLPDDACWVCITSLWLRDICAIFPTKYLAQAPTHWDELPEPPAN